MDGRREYHDAATMLAAEDGFDLRSRLREIKAPTLLLQGEEDIVYPLDLARQTVKGIPDARLVVYQERSHSATSSVDSKKASPRASTRPTVRPRASRSPDAKPRRRTRDAPPGWVGC
ncbi:MULTISPECIES: alpha/beta fold hydrolase [Streptomyces]|uniref:alpha/beta fold hydrolase n=1 Tax=Streptomyces TaxID=1883 RepID=UPI0004C4A6ED|nr:MULTISPECIES: alpha/beta hydrolase [unclassified Streptomyces]KPC80738.1 hypothetical protein ADK82_20095 [Streptomyces sp. NRRL S-4]